MRPIILSAILLLLTSGPLFAQPGFEAGAWKKMNLTDRQEKTLKEIRGTTQKQMIDLRATLQKKRIDLRTVVENDDPDRAVFERLTREIADLQVQQKLLLFDTDRAVSKNLNDEQLKLWKQRKQNRLARFLDGMGGREAQMREGHDGMRDRMHGGRGSMPGPGEDED